MPHHPAPNDRDAGTPAARRGEGKPRRPAAGRAALRRERERTADILHNTVCQELTGICLMASAAARQLHPVCPEASEKLQEIARLLQGAGTGLQEFVRTLRPGG